MSEVHITPPEEAKNLLDAVDKKKPDPAAVAEFAQALKDKPELARIMANVSGWVQKGIIQNLGQAPRSVEMALAQRPAQLRAELGYNEATPLERLLIDHVVTCWLRQQDTELRYTRMMTNGDTTLAQGDYWERRLSGAQRRYLRAVETLAKVRRLLRLPPVMQVNIAGEGGQQVNVAGGLEVTKAGPD